MKFSRHVSGASLILILVSITGYSQENTQADPRKKDIPVFLEFNQLDRGFLSVEADLRSWKDEIFPSFRIFGLSAGYNFWYNDLVIEQKTYFNFVFLSAGLSLAYIDQLSFAETSAFGIKPQVGLDFYALKFYYGYQFTIGNRPEYLNYHNLTMSFFLFGKAEFHTWNEKGNWYSWPSVVKDTRANQ